MARQNAYDQIVSEILKSLEEGVAPWVKPWAGSGAHGAPMNALTKRQYTGINRMVLSLRMMNFSNPNFLTFKQAKNAGGNVRKGEKGSKVVYLGTGRYEDDNGDERAYKFLKSYTVFNVEQCENLPEKLTAWTKPEPFTDQEFIEFCQNTGADIRHGDERAYFAPLMDYVAMPHPQAFKTTDDYKATMLHELTHWTGHKSRLDRNLMVKALDKKGYAFEELIAELGAAFLCADLGVDGKLQHASYIASWIKALKNEPRMLIRAASHASKAAQFLHDQQQAAAIKDAA